MPVLGEVAGQGDDVGRVGEEVAGLLAGQPGRLLPHRAVDVEGGGGAGAERAVGGGAPVGGRRSVLRRGLGHRELADDAQLAAEVPAVPEVVAHRQGRPEELGEGGAHGLHRPAGGSRRHEGELAAVVGGDGRADDGVARLLQGRPAQHGQPPPLLRGQGPALRPAHLPQAGAVEGDRGRGVGDERVQLSELVAGHGLGRPPLRLLQLVEQAQDHGAPHGGHDGPVDPGHRRLDREHGRRRRHVTSVGGRGQPPEVTSAGGVRNSSLTNRATLFTLPRDPPNRPARILADFFSGGLTPCVEASSAL